MILKAGCVIMYYISVVVLIYISSLIYRRTIYKFNDLYKLEIYNNIT